MGAGETYRRVGHLELLDGAGDTVSDPLRTAAEGRARPTIRAKVAQRCVYLSATLSVVAYLAPLQNGACQKIAVKS